MQIININIVLVMFFSVFSFKSRMSSLDMNVFNFEIPCVMFVSQIQFGSQILQIQLFSY